MRGLWDVSGGRSVWHPRDRPVIGGESINDPDGLERILVFISR